MPVQLDPSTARLDASLTDNSPRCTVNEQGKESIISRVEQYRSAMTSDSPTSAFPFLKLPPEIRVYIYQELLPTRLTSIHGYEDRANEWPLKVAPAILCVNKQVFAEASQVLYAENNFIVLKVTEQGDRDTWQHGDRDGFPNLAGLSEKQIPNPFMRIEITELNRYPDRPRRRLVPVNERTYIFTVEGLPYLIELLQRMSTIYNFYSSVGLTVSLFNKVPARHDFLNNHILRSFDQLQGFAQFLISGDVDADVVRHLTECMTLGPQLQDVLSRIAKLFTHGEQYFKQKEYTLAERYWCQMRRYWSYRRLFNSPPTRYSPKDFLEVTLSIVLKVDLSTRIIQLRLKDYASLTWEYTVIRSIRLAKILIDKYFLNYRIPPVLEAKFWLCEYLGHYKRAESTWLGMESTRKTHDLTVSAFCRDYRFAGKSYEVSLELAWARDKYFEHLAGPLQSDEQTLKEETHPEWR